MTMWCSSRNSPNSPILFNIYANGLLNIPDLPGKFYKTKDDTAILINVQDVNVLYENANILSWYC